MHHSKTLKRLKSVSCLRLLEMAAETSCSSALSRAPQICWSSLSSGFILLSSWWFQRHFIFSRQKISSPMWKKEGRKRVIIFWGCAIVLVYKTCFYAEFATTVGKWNVTVLHFLVWTSVHMGTYVFLTEGQNLNADIATVISAKSKYDSSPSGKQSKHWSFYVSAVLGVAFPLGCF